MMDNNVSFDRSGGGAARSPSPAPAPPPRPTPPGRPASLLDPAGAGGAAAQAHVVRVVVCRDERGYGMKVSGDNPVYVQSVKEGGAAEKAGLHAGDKIIKVNGVNVTQSTHTQVVALIRSSNQVVLTVQQRSPNHQRPMTPSMHQRVVSTPNSARITGPQPVDHETQHQLEQEREQYYRLMIEKEQTHLNILRELLAQDPDDERKAADLVKTERNLDTLQAMLRRLRTEPAPADALSPSHRSLPRPLSPNNNQAGGEAPPPLPRRNHRRAGHSSLRATRPLPSPPRAGPDEANANVGGAGPPPLPPRGGALESGALDKQMAYPLVATLVGVVDNSDAPNPTHQRTKSSPETLSTLGVHPGNHAEKRKHSESLNDLTKEWEGVETTPPGTPPPPYPSSPGARRREHGEADERHSEERFVDAQDLSPFVNMVGNALANSSPIHAASTQCAQQSIISMEDDEISDQEISQLEDHGYFKSLSRLWEHLPHLAVFTNYILSNSDPNSLLFYLLTDLYKEGNAREMRKWAFEIHSSFLVPGAPLHLGNVGEDVATEIDEVLLRDYNKEEILRKIFWKARARAKEELARQLAEFQQTRTAGLGTIYGPGDQELSEIYNDKAKETKLYETLLLSKLDMYLEEFEKENADTKRYYTAAALFTVTTRVFQVSPKGHMLEKCPTFVSKEKSFRTKLIPRHSKKLTVLGHQFTAQPYYSVIACNNCHQIIYGISPQGYQCSACLINLHRTCVKLYDDSCPGPIKSKDSRIRKLIRMSHDSTDHNRIKKTSNFLQMERERRQLEDSRDNSFELIETGIAFQLEAKKKSQQQPQTPRCANGRNRNKNRKKSENNGDKKDKDMCNKLVSSGDVVTVLVDNNNVAQSEPDVVLRHDPEKKSLNNAFKRYSDSYVIENGDATEKNEKSDKAEAPPMTRAVSGFFVIDHARKARRFSDLFRPSSTMKLSGSTECLRVEKVDFPPSKEVKNEANNNAKNKKSEKDKKDGSKVNGSLNKTKPAQGCKSETNSYLKRVKSKIYKSKSDDTSKIDLDKKKIKGSKKSLSGIIPEDEVAVISPPGSAKSIFDMRLTRQTSNLEQVRPRPSRVSIDSGELEHKEFEMPVKPLLAKAKSSSAINLNLLRTRRNKILEQVAARKQANAAMSVKDEFDFIAFGSMGKLTGSSTSLNKFPSWLHINKVAEEKSVDEADSSRPGQPVSRSGSDRRPDSVKEESSKLDGASAPNTTPEVAQDADVVKEVATPENSVSLPASGNRRKAGSNINRSESWKESTEKRKQKRNISDPSHNASGEVDLERQGLTNTDSGSSSHSSLSYNGRLSESPSSNSVAGEQQLARVRSLSDTETDLDDGEAEPLNWQERVPQEELKKLDQQELQRQDIINELFSTEASHVLILKVLYHVFYKRLVKSSTLKPDELSLIFPNLKELLDWHVKANNEMRQKRRDDPIVRELGELLVRTFCGPQGEELKRASALFCERQRLALELITRRRERDSKFDAVLVECEKKRQCRRLPFQAILPMQMQRLSKYPLMLERLMGVPGQDEEELKRLKKAHEASKEILQAVDEAAKIAMNRHRLEDIQKRLDTSAFERQDHVIVGEFKNLDLTKYKLVLEGGMQLRRPNKGIVPVHVLLLEEMVVILHREGDSRFTLKFFQSGTPAAPQPLSPIIRMNTMLVRYNAVSKDSLFLVNTATSNCQMYDLIAENESRREEWFRNFSDASDVYNRREGGKPARHKSTSAAPSASAAARATSPGRAPSPPVEEPAPSSGDETVRDLQEHPEEGRAESTVQGGDKENGEAEGSAVTEENDDKAAEGMVVAGAGGAPPSPGVRTRVAADDWPLVQPSQIVVSAPPVLTAERILTPLEQIRRKDQEVREALAAKECLVADLLSIPREHYHTIADMACDTAATTPKDLAERVMASMFQVDLLQKAVNDALNITEADAIEAKGGKPVCASQEAPEKPKIPSVPATVIKDIAASLSSQLITLLNDVKNVEEERDRLRREVDRFREQIHDQYHMHDDVSQDEEIVDSTEAGKSEPVGVAEVHDEVDAAAKGCDKEEVFYETSSENQQ